MDNTITLFGEIGRKANAAVKAHAAGLSGEKFSAVIDSEGGSVFDGLSVYSAVEAYAGETECLIESSAFSIASYIAMAFDRVKITRNGYMMLHNPSTEASGDDTELTNTADMVRKLRMSMIEAYSRKSGISPEAVEKMMRDTTWLNAEEALAAGFVDEIVDYAKPSSVVATAKLKDKMPFRVVAALGGASPEAGEHQPAPKETEEMADKPKPTVKQLKAKFPKASSEFIVKALEEEMTEEQAMEEMVKSLQAENEELKAQAEADKEELAAARAKAEGDEVEPEAEGDDEEEVKPAPAARSGNKPVARVSGGAPAKPAKAMWADAVDSFVAKGLNRPEACKRANKANPGLRQRMLDEQNSQR